MSCRSAGRILGFLALILGSRAWAASVAVSGAGSQAAAWLDLPDSARTAAMGGASVALADDVDTLSVNPAGLGGLEGQQVSLMHNAYVQDTSLEHVAYGLGLGSWGGAAASLDYMNYGSIATSAVSDGVLEPTGALNPYGEGLDLGYGYSVPGLAPRFGRLLVGATLELVAENLTGGATNAAVGGDLGVLWRQSAERGLSAGVAVQNLGSPLDEADLPTNYDAGLGYRLPLLDGRQALTLAADASVPAADADQESLALGGEYTGDSLWAVRAGYKFVGAGGLGGLSVGGGLRYSVATLDYAFVSEGILGGANQISLSAKF